MLEPAPAAASTLPMAAAPPRDTALRWLGHQRWLRYGLRNRLLRRMRDPERAAASTFEVPFAGYVYPGRLDRWIDWIVYYYGGYELDELELMRDLLAARDAAVALDSGANVGHHTLYLASCCAAVHAFEPYAPVAQALEEKVRRNGLTHVHLHRIALGDADSRAEFYAPQGFNTGTGSFVAGHEQANNRAVGQLEIRHADDYLAALGLRRVDLVKIDVEGFELSVLRGLRASLRRFRPLLMLELSDEARRQLATLGDFMALFPPGYEALRVRSQRSRLGVFGLRGCALEPLQWHHRPLPGGYVNLLLRPRPADG